MTMLNYAYKGRDTEGKLVKGRLEAPSEAAAVARMKTMGLVPVEVGRASCRERVY